MVLDKGNVLRPRELYLGIQQWTGGCSRTGPLEIPFVCHNALYLNKAASLRMGA